MKYVEVDYHPREITIWVKDTETQEALVRTYGIYSGSILGSDPNRIGKHIKTLAEKYGAHYIRILERVGGNGYELMREAIQRSGGTEIALEHYVYRDLPL